MGEWKKKCITFINNTFKPFNHEVLLAKQHNIRNKK